MPAARRGWLGAAVDLRTVARLFAPAAVGLGASLVPVEDTTLGLLGGLIAAAFTAALLAFQGNLRLERLREWTGRVTSGERTPMPLARRAPDALDRLGEDLNAMAARLSRETKRLEFERDRLEAILAGMVEGVIVIDQAGQILRANEPVRRTFGLPEGAPLADRKLWDLSRDVEFNAVVREALAGQRPAMREVALHGAEERFLNVTVGPTSDGSAWVLVLHDVTEMKRLERIRTDFVANLSHELRTPLTAIKGFAETLVSTGLGDRETASRYLAIIDRQAERLSRLIEDLLVLSDLELGRMPVRPIPLRIAEIVKEAVELLAEPARKRGVELVVEASPSVWTYADPDRLVQVLSNLLDNAIKFTPAGGRVTVSAHTGADDDVELRVSDTGQGIPAADLPRLAERFYRVDKTRSRESGGTGLGLSIVKHIAQAHGGRLRIESRVGVGTSVIVTFPPAQSRAEPGPSRASG